VHVLQQGARPLRARVRAHGVGAGYAARKEQQGGQCVAVLAFERKLVQAYSFWPRFWGLRRALPAAKPGLCWAQQARRPLLGMTSKQTHWPKAVWCSQMMHTSAA